MVIEAEKCFANILIPIVFEDKALAEEATHAVEKVVVHHEDPIVAKGTLDTHVATSEVKNQA